MLRTSSFNFGMRAWFGRPDPVHRLSPVRLAQKVRRLGVRGARELWTAQWALLRARRALKHRPAGQLLRPVGSPPSSASATTPETIRSLERLAIAVRRASDYGIFVPTCLVRALALEDLARREGAATALVRVGVRRDERGFEAHAWLEIDGRVVGDTLENVQSFTVLEDFSGLPA